MLRAPLATGVLVGLVLVERAVVVILTRKRPPALSVKGYLITGTWAVCYAAPLLGALLRLEWLHGPVSPASSAVGLLAVTAGVALRIAALRWLRRNFSELVVIRENHVLVTGGPYRVLRHPLHAGFLLMMLGFAAVSGAWWAYALAILGVVLSVPRELSEERLLREHFGAEYDAYCRRALGLTDALRFLARFIHEGS